MAGWIRGQIPSAFDVTQHFTYFTDLTVNYGDIEDSPRNTAFYHKTNSKGASYAEARQRLVKQVETQLKMADQTDIDNQQIKIALDFLQQVAANEREKEKNVIKLYKQELHKQFDGLFDNDDWSKFIDNLQFPSNITDITVLDDFYYRLTACFNAIRLEEDRLKARIQLIRKHQDAHNKDLKKANQELDKDTMDFRIGSDMRNIVKRMNGTISRTRKKSLTQALLDGAMEYIRKNEHVKNIIKNAKSAADIASIVVAIAADLARKVEQKFNQAYNSQHPFADLVDIVDNGMDEILENYIRAKEEQQTKLQQLLERGRDNELQELYQMSANTLGIKIEDDTDDLKKMQDAQAKTNQRSTQALRKKFKALGVEDTVLEQFNRVTFSASTNIHGNIAEYRKDILEPLTKKVLGNPATDTITIDLGYITLNAEMQDDTNEILTSMAQNLAQLDADTREKDNEKRELLMKEHNQQLNDKIDRIEEILNKTSDQGTPKEFFVYHDSIKFYQHAELGTLDAFDGRSLKILYALNNLYSMSDAPLPDKDLMITLALNLSESAINGANNLPVVEKWFSIFTGMLMFDDLANMAKSAARALANETNGRDHVVHMYQLNTFYVPASMVLTYAYYSLAQGLQKAAGYTASADIITSGATSIINKHVEALNQPTHNQFPNYTAQWPSLAEDIGQATSIKIQFFSAFIDFVTKLSAIMGYSG